MPNSFVETPLAAAAQKRPRVLVVCPSSLLLEDAQAIKYAFEDNGCSVSLYRTNDDFRFADVRDEMQDKSRPFTHLLLVLGQFNGYDDGILHEAEQMQIRNLALFALHSRDALDRHAVKIASNRVQLIAVRTPAEHAHVQKRWGSIQSLIVEDVRNDACRLSELLIGRFARTPSAA